MKKSFDNERKSMSASLTGSERVMEDTDTLVSMTDLKGKVIYANRAFLKIAGLTSEEMYGKAHSIVRHPDMPRSAFHDFWETIQAGNPWNGIVVNRSANGDHYWVDANVSPRLENGQVVGFMSVRRKPSREQIETASKLYANVLNGKVEFPSSAAKATTFGQRFVRLLWGMAAVPLIVAAVSELDHGLRGFLISLIPAVIGGGTLIWYGVRIWRAHKADLQQAVDWANEMAGGNLSLQIPHNRNDEVGAVYKGLLNMLINTGAVLAQIKESVESLDLSAGELTGASATLSDGLQEVAKQSEAFTTIASTATQMNQNLQSVTSAAEEMSISIAEVARKAAESAQVAERAKGTSSDMNAIVEELGQNAREIGKVIESIAEIASQTNLLALNAAIEAAGAGEAGRGFAVVAAEVKELARQSALSSDEIKTKISAIQDSTRRVIDSIGSINTVISQMNEISGGIASSVEEQSITTKEIASNISETAGASNEVTRNINGVSGAILTGAGETAKFAILAKDLKELAVGLNGLVGRFRINAGTGARRAGYAES